MKATYIGPIPHLKGKTAMVRPSTEEGFILAQFDDRNLTSDGKPIPQRTVLDYEPHARFPTEQQVPYETPPTQALGFNWHKFPKDHFKVEENNGQD